MDSAALPSSPVVALRMGAGVSGDGNPLRAVDRVCEEAAAGLKGASADLCVLFMSAHHVDAARAIAYVVRKRLGPRCLVGMTAETVVGGASELEGTPGVSLLAASLPGVDVRGFRLERAPSRSAGAEELATLASLAGMSGKLGYRGSILLADPFSMPMNALLPAMSRARPERGAGAAETGRGAIVGGMASAATKPAGNALLLDEAQYNSGAVGVSLSGAVKIDTMVSQGCRPFGPTFVITGARNQMVLTLSGRPAMVALHEAIETLSERTKSLLQRGLFIGRVVNEYKERFGRGDFLIRPVIGAEQETGMLAVGDLMRVGQTVQFHLRDAETASEDLGLLLDREQLYDVPAGALLFTCNGRGTKLFDTPNHDAAAIARAFSRDAGGEEKAKAGVLIGEGGAGVPLAGCFAAGEIGPIGDEAFLHGHTASVALFRAPAEPRP